MKALSCLIFVALASTFPCSAEAQANDAEAQPAAAATADDPGTSREEELRRQTRRVRALIAGRLDPRVDPQDLFSVQLADTDAAKQLASVLRMLNESERSSQRARPDRPIVPEPSKPADDLSKARDELARAQVEFLSLPSSQRHRLLAAHEARRQAAMQRTEVDDVKQETLQSLKRRVEQLEALLEGKLDKSVDVTALLRVDLTDVDEVALDPNRRRAFAAEESPRPVETETKAASATQTQTGIDEAIATARKRIDQLRRRFVELDEQTRDAVLAGRHDHVESPPGVAARINEADQKARSAAAERKQAVEEAQSTESEAIKLAAAQRADLLAVKERQAIYAGELATRRGELAAAMDSALAWSRRVNELAEAPLTDRQRTRKANDLYENLVAALTDARNALREALNAPSPNGAAVPAPVPNKRAPLPPDFDDSDLQALRFELEEYAEILRTEQTQLGRDRQEGLRDALVTMNRSRLELFEMLSPERRDEVSGFGPDGIAQVKRELDLITLEARYHIRSLPRRLEDLQVRLKTSPLPIFTMFFQLLLLLLLFRWWRRKADGFLEGVQRTWLHKRPQTELTRGVAGLAWYLRRIRKPVEWLLFLTLAAEVISGHLGGFREFTYLRIVVLWALIGALVVRLIDAVAARQGHSSESTSTRRFRSLRLVGVTVVVVGLILSIADATVGKGAVFAWVISTCWVLAVPILIVLVFWWMDAIFERAGVEESDTVLRWVHAHEHGVLRFPAAVVGGVYLLADGVYRFLVSQVTEFTIARSALAYLFRRGVEKQTSTATTEKDLTPLPPAVYEKLGTDMSSADELITSYMSSQVHAMRALVRSKRAAIVAIAGERGEGKTTFLGRIVNDLEPSERCFISCGYGGIDALREQIAAAIELPEDADEGRIIERLRERAPRVVCVDDTQRLIKPLIGGLEQIDALVRLMRESHPTTTWLIALGMPAWQYLRRARDERTPFDEIIELATWEEAQIAKLVEARTQAAGIAPNFSKVVVPQQFAGSRVSIDERLRRDFFRILWDYSGGNAGVALHYWRESLYVHPSDEQIYVRIPQVPSAGELEGQPNSMYFVLRTVLQLERATEEDVVRCTDLDPAEVGDALRAARVQGYVERVDRVFTISIHWYRAVTNVLGRKHLMQF